MQAPVSDLIPFPVKILGTWKRDRRFEYDQRIAATLPAPIMLLAPSAGKMLSVTAFD
jgi:hypothetical protein